MKNPIYLSLAFFFSFIFVFIQFILIFFPIPNLLLSHHPPNSAFPSNPLTTTAPNPFVFLPFFCHPPLLPDVVLFLPSLFLLLFRYLNVFQPLQLGGVKEMSPHRHYRSFTGCIRNLVVDSQVILQYEHVGL